MEKIVYHGSHDGNIEMIKSHVGTHQKQCIYATDNMVIAMLFMNRGMGDLDTIKIYVSIGTGIRQVVVTSVFTGVCVPLRPMSTNLTIAFFMA